MLIKVSKNSGEVGWWAKTSVRLKGLGGCFVSGLGFSKTSAPLRKMGSPTTIPSYENRNRPDHKPEET
jgi:hypothetical protein